MPVLNTVNAKGVMPSSHPLAVGGSPSLPCIREAMRNADVVLAVGTEFGETDYDMLFVGALEFGGDLIRIDIDARQLARNVRAELGLVGDAALCLRGLLPCLTAATGIRGEQRALELRAAIQGEEHYHPQFQRLFETIQASSPQLLLVGDSTLPTYYAVWQYEAEQARRYFHSATGGGTLGFAIPAALGASLARPDLDVVALIGDGSSQFTLSELAAGVEAGLGVAVIIWNNDGYGEIKQGMVAAAIEPVGVDIYTPDLLAVASGLGCDAVRAASLEELTAALKKAAQRDRPTVVELLQTDFISQPAGQWY
jgi:acetolactate synthase-1/2/3 large subunit